MTLAEALKDASERCHCYCTWSIWIYRVRRHDEVIYTTADWAAREGRPVIARVKRDDVDGPAKWTLFSCAYKREQKEILAWLEANNVASD